MAWGDRALSDKALIVALRCDHADIVSCRAALGTGILYNIQTGTRAERRVTLLQFHEAASGAEEATPFFRQGVVA